MERSHYEGRRSSLINKSMVALKDNAARYSSKVEPLTSNYPRKRRSSMVTDSPKEARLDPSYNSNNAAAAGSPSSNKGLHEYVRDKIDRNFSRQGTNEPSNVYQLPEYLPLESEGPRDRTLSPQHPMLLKDSRMHPYEPKVPSKDRHHLRGPSLANLYVNEWEQNAAGAKNFRDRLRRNSDGSRPYSESLKSYHIPKVRMSKDAQERSVSQDKTPKLPEAKTIYKSSSNPGSPRYTPTNTPPISPKYNKKDLPTTKNGASPIDMVSSHADTVSSASKPDIGCDTSGNRNHLDGDGGKQMPTLAKDPRRSDTSTHDVLPFKNFNTTTDKNGASLSSDPKGVSQSIKFINPKISKLAANRGPEVASSSKPPQRLDSRDKYLNNRTRKSSNSGMSVKDFTGLCKPPLLPTADKRHASGNCHVNDSCLGIIGDTKRWPTVEMATNEDGSVLTCELCTKVYKDPVMLPCLHSFCLDCLTKYADKEGLANGKVVCYTCKVPSPLPESSISSFSSNLRLSHLVELRHYQTKIMGKETAPCEQCNNTPAAIFCSNCRKLMCTGCRDNHQKWQDLRNHKMYELDLFKKDVEKQIFEIMLPLQECHTHNDILMYYCEECKVPICKECTIVDHEKHPRDYIWKIADQERSQITELMANMPDTINKLNDAIARGKQMRSQVETSLNTSSAMINSACDQLKKTIKERRKELLANSKTIAQGKDNVLSIQIQELKTLKDTIEFCFAQAEDAAKNYTADELICITTAVKQQVDKVVKQFQDISLDLRENEKMGTSMVIAPMLQKIKNLGHFPGVADPKNSYVEGAGIKLAVVGVERKFKVVLMDEKNEAIKDDVLFQYQVAYKGATPVMPKGAIKQSGAKDGTAYLSFIPTEAGIYDVTIYVRKSPIKQQPYRVWAHLPRNYAIMPAQPTVTFFCGGYVYGAALHPSGDLYVAECDLNLIQVFKSDGSKKLTIGGQDNARGELKNPWGVAIIDDVIYVASSGNSCIKMYALNGNHVGTISKHGTGNTDLNVPCGICSDGKGHLLVADYSNKRIQIFSTDGNIYKTIPCDTNPLDVAVDVEGNIHVTANKMIQVFTPAGTKLNTYNINNTLIGPQAIAVHADGTKLITDSNLVRVVNAAGAEVANRGGLSSPCGILFGYCGAIYICDAGNKRVVKY